MRALLVTVSLASALAWADPSARLLPQHAPPAAIDLSGSRKLVVVSIAAGAVLTSLALIIAIAIKSSSSGLVFPNTVQIPEG